MLGVAVCRVRPLYVRDFFFYFLFCLAENEERERVGCCWSARCSIVIFLISYFSNAVVFCV